MKITNIWDIHCHVVPDVDDGAKNLETALDLLKKEYEDGVRHIICTPHYRAGMFEPDMEKVHRNFDLLKKEAVKQIGKMELQLGCEFHSNMDMIDMLKAGKRPTMGKSKVVLLEFSGADTFLYMRERTHALLEAGYQPIIAHAERFPVLRKNIQNLEQLTLEGAMIQINAESIIKEKGIFSDKFCSKAIDQGLVSFVASDAHDMSQRRPRMQEASEILQKRHGVRMARKLLIHNAEELFSL